MNSNLKIIGKFEHIENQRFSNFPTSKARLPIAYGIAQHGVREHSQWGKKL
jgi:hypothetical protein